jgi:carbon monoxide dehydrogenase subunit G
VTVFSASKRSSAVVPFPREAVWALLTDPHQVARLTPMVRSIQPRGDLWLWKLAPIEVLGHSVGLSFTERMEFTPQERIVYTHTPTGDERAGVEGTYLLEDTGSGTRSAAGTHGTRLTIELGVAVDPPSPRLARPAVQASMHGVIAAMGAGFAHNLDRQLKA